MTILRDDTFIITVFSDGDASLGGDKDSDGNGFVEGTDISGDVVIPDIILGNKITCIGKYAIKECRKITSLRLPSTITKIEYAGITWCDHFEELIIPKAVREIGDYFDCLKACKRVVFEQGSRLRKVGSYFLRYCDVLEELVFPPLLKSIGESLFQQSKMMKRIQYYGRSNFAALTNPFDAITQDLEIFVSSFYPSNLFGGKNITRLSSSFCAFLKPTCFIRKTDTLPTSTVIIINLLLYY